MNLVLFKNARQQIFTFFYFSLRLSEAFLCARLSVAFALAAGVSEPGYSNRRLQLITSHYFLTGADAVSVAAAALEWPSA